MMATEQAPQSPSAQPSLAPVRPVLRRYSSRGVFGETSSTRRLRPLSVNSMALGISGKATVLRAGRTVNEIQGLLRCRSRCGTLLAVKRSCIVGALLLCAFLAWGQDDSMPLDELVQSANQWAKENLDDEALRALQDVDREKVKQFRSEEHTSELQSL